MTTSEPPPSTNRAWAEHWRQWGPKLDQIRRDELRRFRHEDHQEAIDALLQIAHEHAAPRLTSGLVEQQRLFRQARR